MTTESVGAFEAKTRLSELLEQVRKGQVYRISKRGRTVVSSDAIFRKCGAQLVW